MKIIFLLVIINTIKGFLNRIFSLSKELSAGSCCKCLKQEKCSHILWNHLFFEKKQYCSREKCFGFETVNGDKIFSVNSIINIIIEQSPSIATVILLWNELFN